MNGDAAWVDVGALECTEDVDGEETGAGALASYRGEPGFVCVKREDGALVLINARHVVALRVEAGLAEVETARGLKIAVAHPSPERCVGLINSAQRQA